MSTNLEPTAPFGGMRDASETRLQCSDMSREEMSKPDGLPSFVSTGARMDYACQVAIKENREIRSESALAEKVGCPLGSLRAMRKDTYSAPRSTAGLDVMKRIALLSGVSFEWIRYGEGKTPLVISEAEAAALVTELSGNAQPTQAAALGAAEAIVSVGRRQIDPFLFAQVIGAIESHPRRINYGWTCTVIIPCAIAIYNATVSGQITSANWAEFIQTFSCY